MRTIDFCMEGPGKRKIWSSLTIAEGEQNAVVIMAHGFLGFKDWAFFPWLADFFAQSGFPSLRFNFSGSGMGSHKDGPFQELDAFERDTITRQVEDLHFAFSSLKDGNLPLSSRASEKIFLWGHSRGGAICLLEAAQNPAVNAVAAWATISRVNRYFYQAKQSWRQQGFSSFESSRTGQILKYSTDFLADAENWGKRGDVPTFLNRLDIPVLLVHGSEDTSVSPEESESLAATRPPTRFVLLAGANHKFNASHPFEEPPTALREAAQKTVDFYQSLIS